MNLIIGRRITYRRGSCTTRLRRGTLHQTVAIRYLYTSNNPSVNNITRRKNYYSNVLAWYNAFMGVTEGFIDAGKKNFAIANAKRKAEADIKRQARWEIAERKRLIKKLIKLMRARATYIRKEETLARKNRHGVSVGDYTRCKKLNGKACAPCRATAAQYVREKFHSDPKYKETEKRWKKANPDKVRNNKNKKRLKGGKHRSYTRNQIIKRDGVNCYLCRTPVDFEASHVQGQLGWELYPHVEHVIPLALGGDDLLDNVKLAHAKCNIDKGVGLLPA